MVNSKRTLVDVSENTEFLKNTTRMLKLLCLIVLATVVHCEAKRCCLPQTWQLRQQTVGAQMSNKSRALYTYTEDIYYDSVDRRMRQDFFTSNITVTLLQLYNADVGFRIVNNKTCYIFKPGPFPGPFCVPESWVKSKEFRLGFKPNINVVDYGHKDKVSTYINLEDNCSPISITSFGSTADVMVLYAALFENYLPDIPSPSVFNVPSVCKHAMKDQAFVYEPLHEKMFWREMFTGYIPDF